MVEFLITCNETFTRILNVERTHRNLTFRFRKLRVIETSVEIIIADFYSQLFVESLRTLLL